jgi:hypothetical protein
VRRPASTGNPLLDWHFRLAQITGYLALHGGKRVASKSDLIRFSAALREVADAMEKFVDDKDRI